MDSKEKYMIINSFVHAKLNDDPQVWHFCPVKQIRKKIQERSLKIMMNLIVITKVYLNPQFIKNIFQKNKG